MTTSLPRTPASLILASSSRYRAELLQRLRIPFHQIAPDVDETRMADEPPQVYVERLARAKATAIVERESPANAVVIGSDQTSVNGDCILGKPHDAATAERQLMAASGHTVSFYTAVAVHHAGRSESRVVIDRVRFRTLNAEEIRRYIAVEQPLDCAGAFRAEGLGISLFEGIDSTDPSALVGLPLITVSALLRAVGFSLP